MTKVLITNRKRKRQYYKAFLLIFCSIEILMLFSTVLLFDNFKNAAQEKITDLNYEITAKVGNTVSYMNELIDNFCNVIYFDPTVTNLMYQHGQLSEFEIQKSLNRLNSIAQSYTVIDSVIIYNKRLNRFYSMMDSHTDDEILNLIRNKEVLPYMPVIRNLPLEAYLKDSATLTYIKCEQSPEDNSIDAAVVINVKTDWLQRIIKSEAPEDVNLFLIDSNKNVVADSKGSSTMYKLERDYLHTIDEQQINNYSNTVIIDGKKMLTILYRIPEIDCYLVNECSYASVYQAISAVRWVMFLIIGVLTVIGMFLAAFIADKLYKPFQTILNTVENNFSNLKQDQFKSEEQYIEEAILHSKKFINSYDSYLIYKFLESDGRISRDDLSYLTQNTRLSGYFSVFLILIDGLEEMEDIQSCFQEVNCDILAAGHEKAVVLADSGARIAAEEAAEKISGASRCVCIGHDCYTTELLLQEYRRLLQLMRYRVMYDGHNILTEEMIEENLNDKKFTFPDAICAKIISALREDKQDEAEMQLNHFLNAISRNDISNYFMALIQLLLSLRMEFHNLEGNRNYQMETLLSAKQRMDVTEFFAGLFSHITESRQETPESGSTKIAAVLQDYIERHFTDQRLCVKAIAQEFNMSPVYIGRVFRQSFHYAIADYINELRIRRAMELLENTQHSVSKIMKMVGYESESTFFKIFKAYCGTTPRAYRISLTQAKKD